MKHLPAISVSKGTDYTTGGFIHIWVCSEDHEHMPDRQCVFSSRIKSTFRHSSFLEGLSNIKFLKFLSLENRLKRKIKNIKQELMFINNQNVDDTIDTINAVEKEMTKLEADLNEKGIG